MRIAVAGSTGAVGHHVAQVAIEAGHEVVAINRSAGVDARTGTGLASALRDVAAIVDTTNSSATRRSKATEFFSEVAGNLQSLGAANGVSRLVMLSIIGADRFPSFGYYQAKLAQEAAARAGPLPVTIVRATQFHEFPDQILSRTRFGPIALVPVMKIQPVAARAVAEVLVGMATKDSQQETVEVAGPQQKDLVAMARAMVRKRHWHTAVVPLLMPGSTGNSMRRGELLPSTQAEIVGPTFDEWLSDADSVTETP